MPSRRRIKTSFGTACASPPSRGHMVGLMEDKRMRYAALAILMTAVLICLSSDLRAESSKTLDDELAAVLKAQGFTGRSEARFREKLGRPVDRQRADLGRLLWFDIIGGAHHDKTLRGRPPPPDRVGGTPTDAVPS